MNFIALEIKVLQALQENNFVFYFFLGVATCLIFISAYGQDAECSPSWPHNTWDR